MRRSIDVTISGEGRDKNKVYRLTEMPAMQAESWACRAVGALARAGVELPNDIANAGWSGLAAIGLRALGKIQWADAEPLMQEMLGCIRVVPDPSRPMVVRQMMPNGEGGDIDEVTTLLQLRLEILKLHMDFSKGAGQLLSKPAPELSFPS